MVTAGSVQPQVDALGVEAAWRVGDWQLLDEYVQSAENGNDSLDAQSQWEVQLGHLLCASQQRYCLHLLNSYLQIQAQDNAL